MKRDEKILYACKNNDCAVVIGCFNILSKDSGVPCSTCPVKDNCTMKAAPLKYANTFTIEQDSLCDSCWEKEQK